MTAASSRARFGQQPDVEFVEIVSSEDATLDMVKIGKGMPIELRINGQPVGYIADPEIDVTSNNGVSVRVTLYPRSLSVRQEVRKSDASVVAASRPTLGDAAPPA